jgi:beta-lactamase class A
MRTVASLLIIAACTTLLLGAGSARAVAPPPTPAGRQLEWLLTKLNGSSVPSNVELKRHFSPRFLHAVPPEHLLEALAPVWSGRPLRLGAVLARDGRLGVRVRVTTRTGASFRVVLVVSSESSHRIEGLLIQPLAQSRVDSWRAVDVALGRLGGRASLYASLADGHLIHASGGHTPGAIGSAFKLYVLGALSDAIEHGRAGWREQLGIRDRWKSLPSGAMHREPAGKRFSLRHFAEQMISVSDNTAADHLIGRLGRPAIETELTALDNHSIARNQPFLTTRELFALKLAAPALRQVFASASSARRRQLLRRVDALEPTVRAATDWTRPRSIDQIEWFASPADLGHAMATLVDRARRPGLQAVRSILAINPGIQLDRELWPYVGFKGGSEPGVLSLTWYLQRRDERRLVLSIVINDSGHDIDTVAAVGVARAAIGLLARS